MIFAPAGYTVQPTAEGAILDGPCGRILHVERELPLRRLGDFVRARGGEVGEVERLVTDEGEHGALAVGRGAVWGVVFGDDAFAWYEAKGAGDLRTPIGALVRTHRLGLGPRRRRYGYTPPAGWDAIARGLHTDWLAPGFPHRWAVVSVYAAEPASTAATAILPSLLARAAAYGFVPAAPPEVEERTTDDGMAGLEVAVEGAWGDLTVRRRLAAFLDDHHVYALELHDRTRDPAILEAFSTLQRTVARLPRPRLPSTWVE
jgi:hypothetical protein